MRIPTEPIGSIPRPPALIDAIASIGDGTDPSLEPLYDEATRSTIRSFWARVAGTALAERVLEGTRVRQ